MVCHAVQFLLREFRQIANEIISESLELPAVHKFRYFLDELLMLLA